MSKEKERNREETMPIPNTLAHKIRADFRAEKSMGAKHFFVTLCKSGGSAPNPFLVISLIMVVLYIYIQGSKLRGAEGQNAPKLSPNAPRLLNLGAKFCYPI